MSSSKPRNIIGTMLLVLVVLAVLDQGRNSFVVQCDTHTIRASSPARLTGQTTTPASDLESIATEESEQQEIKKSKPLSSLARQLNSIDSYLEERARQIESLNSRQSSDQPSSTGSAGNESSRGRSLYYAGYSAPYSSQQQRPYQQMVTEYGPNTSGGYGSRPAYRRVTGQRPQYQYATGNTGPHLSWSRNKGYLPEYRSNGPVYTTNNDNNYQQQSQYYQQSPPTIYQSNLWVRPYGEQVDFYHAGGFDQGQPQLPQLGLDETVTELGKPSVKFYVSSLKNHYANSKHQYKTVLSFKEGKRHQEHLLYPEQVLQPDFYVQQGAFQELVHKPEAEQKIEKVEGLLEKKKDALAAVESLEKDKAKAKGEFVEDLLKKKGHSIEADKHEAPPKAGHVNENDNVSGKPQLVEAPAGHKEEAKVGSVEELANEKKGLAKLIEDGAKKDKAKEKAKLVEDLEEKKKNLVEAIGEVERDKVASKVDIVEQKKEAKKGLFDHLVGEKKVKAVTLKEAEKDKATKVGVGEFLAGKEKHLAASEEDAEVGPTKEPVERKKGAGTSQLEGLAGDRKDLVEAIEDTDKDKDKNKAAGTTTKGEPEEDQVENRESLHDASKSEEKDEPVPKEVILVEDPGDKEPASDGSHVADAKSGPVLEPVEGPEASDREQLGAEQRNDPDQVGPLESNANLTKEKSPEGPKDDPEESSAGDTATTVPAANDEVALADLLRKIKAAEADGDNKSSAKVEKPTKKLTANKVKLAEVVPDQSSTGGEPEAASDGHRPKTTGSLGPIGDEKDGFKVLEKVPNREQALQELNGNPERAGPLGKEAGNQAEEKVTGSSEASKEDPEEGSTRGAAPATTAAAAATTTDPAGKNGFSLAELLGGKKSGEAEHNDELEKKLFDILRAGQDELGLLLEKIEQARAQGLEGKLADKEKESAVEKFVKKKKQAKS